MTQHHKRHDGNGTINRKRRQLTENLQNVEKSVAVSQNFLVGGNV